MNELNIPKQADLKVIPKDETVNATIVDLEVKTWSEITKDETKKKNLKDPDGKVLKVRYDADSLIRVESFPFTEKPTTTSRYGRFIVKYGDFVVGKEIKVQFDADGNSDIIIAK